MKLSLIIGFPGSISFSVDASNVYFTDTRIIVRMMFQVLNRTSTGVRDLTATDNVAICNMFASAAFSGITVSLNSVPIETHNSLSYPYIVRIVRPY